MWRIAVSRSLILVIGVIAGIVLEARVIYPLRANSLLPQGEAGVSPLNATELLATQGTGTPANDASSLASTSGIPRLIVDEPTFSFGEADQGAQIPHIFTIRNAGNGTLHITGVKPSCGCTTATLGRSALAPGETTSVTTSLNLRGKSGQQNQRIVIQSNDPDRPTIQLAIVGHATTLVAMEPALLNLGRVRPGAAVVGTVMVNANEKATFHVTGTHTSSNNLTASVEELEAGKLFRVTVSLAQPAKDGPFRAEVVLLTDHPGSFRELPIPIQAQIGEGGPLLVGDKPEIAGPTLGGAAVDISTLRGKPVVVVFWASWCGHCKNEVPRILALYKKYSDAGVHIVGVNTDHDISQAEEASRNWALPWPNIHFPSDPGSPGGKDPLSTRYSINGIPAVYLLDASGTVVTTDARGDALEGHLKTLLQEGTTPTTVGAL